MEYSKNPSQEDRLGKINICYGSRWVWEHLTRPSSIENILRK